MQELTTAYHYGFFDYRFHPETKEVPIKVLRGLTRYGVTLKELESAYLQGRSEAERNKDSKPKGLNLHKIKENNNKCPL